MSRWPNERPTSGVCECGNPRRRPDGSIAPACPRCSHLDGTDLSPVARQLLSELRQLGRATWDAIRHELPDRDQRVLARAMALLTSVGRVRRLEEEVVVPMETSNIRPWGRRGERVRGRRECVKAMAAFELVDGRCAR